MSSSKRALFPKLVNALPDTSHQPLKLIFFQLQQDAQVNLSLQKPLSVF
jgi:hypothetical protein